MGGSAVRDVLVSLDLATRTGWAVLDLRGRLVESGTWTLAPRRGRSKADRWARFAEALAELLARHDGRVAVLAVERPLPSRGHMGGAVPAVAWGLVALAELAAERRQISTLQVPPAAAKKAASGRGNASKLQVAKAINQRLKLRLAAGDEADAIAVGLAVLQSLDLEALARGEVAERRAA